MKRLLLLLVGAAIALHANAQDTDKHDFSYFLTQSPVLPNAEVNRTYALINNDSAGYYVLRFDKYKTKGEIEHYNPLLQHLATYEATDKARKYVGFIGIKEKMYLLYFNYVRNEVADIYERVSLYAKTISRPSFQIAKDSVALIEPFKMESNYYKGNFSVSPDQSKILVFDYEEDGDIEGISGLTNEITLRVFDANLKLLWIRKVDLSLPDNPQRVVVIKKLRINNKGEVAILTDIFRKERSYTEKYVTADPTLYFVGQQANDFARFTPNLGEFFFNQIDFTFDNDGNIIWFGFYSKMRYYQQSGIFYLKINASKTKVLVKKRHDFTEEFIREVTGKKGGKRFTELSHYKLANWRRDANGGITLTIEHQPYAPFSFKSHGVVALQLTGEGEIKWQKFIYKLSSQSKKMEPFLSHYLATDNDYTYILYNDGIYSDGLSRVYQIDSTGKTRRRVVLMYDSQAELICPQLSYPLGNGQLFLCLQDRFFQSHRVAILDMRRLFEKKE